MGGFLMAKHKVEISGVNTNDLVVLKEKEIIELFKKYKENNDQDARNQLINGNLKLVLSIIKRFRDRNINLDDLFQIGCVGLCKAIDNFDLSYNVKLSTYAVPMILGEVKRYLRDNNSLHVSRSLKDLAYLILKTKEKLAQSLNRNVTLEDISNYLEIDIVDIYNSLDSISKPVSIYEPIYNDGSDTIYLYDQIGSDTNYLDDLALSDAINKLDEREKYIINERYIIGKTQTELSEELNISQAQISRLEKDAINVLKKELK